MSTLTILLARARFGERGARDALVAAAYPKLRPLVAEWLDEHGRISMTHATELKQLYVSRLVEAGELRIEDEPEFFTYVPQIMRLVIADIARARIAERRMNPDEKMESSKSRTRRARQLDDCIVQLREALEKLASSEPRLAQVLEMGWCAGYSEREIADELAVTERTVQRDWTRARRLLKGILAKFHCSSLR